MTQATERQVSATGSRWMTPVVALLFFLASVGATAAAPVLPLTEDMQRVSLNPYLFELEDPDATLDIEAIIARDADFQPVAKVIEHGFSRHAWWFRFEATNEGANAIRPILETNVGFHNDIRLYTVERGKVVTQYATGLNKPFSERFIQEPHLALPISVPAHSQRTFYIRLQSNGHLMLPLTISGSQYHLNHLLRDRMFDNLFYGLAIGLILYNFFLFLSTRQNAFGLYAVHLAFAIVTLSAADEGSFFEIWPAFLRGYEYVSMFVAALLAMSSMLLFADVFMGVRTHMPSLSRANRTFAIASVLLALVVPVLPPIWMTGGVMILALLLFIFITLQSWILWRRGIANSGIYFFASIVLVLFIGMVFVCSPFVGIVNNTVIAHYGMNVGYSIQMLLLSVGLGRQINELKEKGLAINTELLKARLKEVTASMAVTEAQAESEAKSRFLAAMSHEIRTPMNGVLGMTELLSGTKLDREQRHYVDAVLSSGRALLNILNDILDYSKIAAGKLELETIPFDMHRLSKDVMEIFAVQKRRQIHAALDIDPCVPALLCGDPTRLRQVLMNLLSNAFKFTESGQVSLRVQCVEQRASEVQVRLIVSDTGVGITPEQQKKLFQSFTQADASTTRRFGGTGLGLSISRDLIGLMGGTIEIESVPEQGTRVTVLLSFALPDEQTLREVQMAAGQPQAAQAMQLPGLCVLVAEDNPVNCMVVEGLLRRLGAHSTVVHHGQAALEVYREDHAAFDAILMDCEMPVMDGYAAVAAIRILEEENAWPRVPILALSAHMADESPQHAGFDAFLMKPVNIKQLHQALQRYWQA